MTQKERIIKYIDDFGSITSFQAYSDLGITQLGARIFELKQLGYRFKTQDRRTKNKYGDNVHFVEYSWEMEEC